MGRAEPGTNTHTLLYMKQVTSKDLQGNARSSTQHAAVAESESGLGALPVCETMRLLELR